MNSTTPMTSMMTSTTSTISIVDKKFSSTIVDKRMSSTIVDKKISSTIVDKKKFIYNCTNFDLNNYDLNSDIYCFCLLKKGEDKDEAEFWQLDLEATDQIQERKEIFKSFLSGATFRRGGLVETALIKSGVREPESQL